MTQPARTWVPAARLALLGAAILAVALLTYWSSIWMRYGRLDDYLYVQATRRDGLGDLYIPFNLDMGRPVVGWLTGGILPGADTVAELGRLRLIVVSLMALSGAAAALVALHVTRGGTTWVRYAAAFGVGVTPLILTSAPSTATWAILMGALHAFSTALLAGLLTAWQHRLWWVPSFALLLVTAFSYQQIVPLALLPALLVTATAHAQRGDRVHWWRPVAVGVMGVVSLGLNAALILTRDGVGASRVGQGTWSERIDWYVNSFLPVALDLHVPSTGEGAVWSGLLALALACTPLLLGLRHAVLPVAVVLATAACALAVLPLELWASYRVAGSTQFCLWVGAATCLAYTVAHVKWRAVSWAGVIGGAALLVVGLTTNQVRAEDYLAAPNARDWANVRCVMGDGTDFDPADKLYVAPFGASTSPVIIGDEYGIVGSTVSWALQAQLWLAQDVVDGPGLPAWEGTNPDVLGLVEPLEEGREVFPDDACAR